MLRAHCEREGRNYDDIEKTVIQTFDVGARGENVGSLIETLRGYASLRFQEVHGSVTNVAALTPLEILGREVIPAVADL